MHRMLCVGNLSWKIATRYFSFNSFESCKDLPPEQFCSNHQAKKQGSAGLDKLRTTTLRHKTQTRFCHFFGVTLFFVSLG